MPYNYEIVKIIVDDAIEICKMENNLHNNHKNVIYASLIKFSGCTECFSELFI